ncbi:YtpR family tRNA-binding protein [uncultured Lactobacillus sp.]|uniref:YtpR family tRNA-binding protein n=1 Tax=uncultured Lactobacillus sp. TaxID=153152 RepID=UPI002605C871|nr:DUF4479 and tRNA-binding domain-containing protein [uncultured Lactobacillus sp.]
MIVSTNKASYPDTLIVITGPDNGRSQFVEKDNVTRVEDADGNLIGYNFFNVSDFLDYDALPNGQVHPNQELVDKLNEKVNEAGFDEKLELGKPTLVYGYVKTCEPHPDSDHLHVTTVDVGNDEVHQIVCGAPNIAQGQKVVVALPGTLMPNGQQIWPGELRGVDSYGMICSARELGLAHAPQKRGIMVVPDSFKAGDEFEPTKCDELLASGQITL